MDFFLWEKVTLLLSSGCFSGSGLSLTPASLIDILIRNEKYIYLDFFGLVIIKVATPQQRFLHNQTPEEWQECFVVPPSFLYSRPGPEKN